MMVKRCLDFFLSSLGLLFLSPLLILIAALIRIDSPGPIFFRQQRVGYRGKLFYIHKFRTMFTGAEIMGLQITVGADARVTRVGGWLRKYKLDELPQLLDVWIGDMSLVGPRPEVPFYVNYYPHDLKELIQSVRPGITDLASLKFRNENEILALARDPQMTYINDILPVKLSYYGDYAANNNILVDIRIIIKTIRILLG